MALFLATSHQRSALRQFDALPRNRRQSQDGSPTAWLPACQPLALGDPTAMLKRASCAQEVPRGPDQRFQLTVPLPLLPSELHIDAPGARGFPHRAAPVMCHCPGLLCLLILDTFVEFLPLQPGLKRQRSPEEGAQEKAGAKKLEQREPRSAMPFLSSHPDRVTG